MPALMFAPVVASARPAQAARCSGARPFQAAAKAPRRALYFHSRQFVVKAAEEEVEEVVEEEVVEEEEEDVPRPTDIEALNAARLARLEAEVGQQAEDVRFSLNFLWLDKQIGVAVDQVFKKGQRSPVTEFFFWPRKDAWEELSAALTAKPWISESDRVALLNQCTEVINFWQDETKHSIAEAQAKFGEDCKFVGV